MREPTIELKAELIKSLRNKTISNTATRLIRGFEGEQKFDKIVDQFANPDWQIITDFSFDIGTLTQIDAIIITPNQIFVYEIKNYDANCQVKDDIFLFNGLEVANNPFTQLKAIKSRFNSVLHKIGYKGKASYHIVMMDENCFMDNRAQVSDLIMRNELKTHLLTINSKLFNDHIFNPEILTNQICSFEISNSHSLNYNMNSSEVAPGILCYECGSLDTYASYKQIKCSNCFNRMSKSAALEQQIGELSVLNNRQPINTRQVYLYSNGIFPIKFISTNISKILNRYAHNKRQYHTSLELFDFQKARELLRTSQNY